MRHAWTAAVLAAVGLAGCGGPTVMRFQGGERVNQRKTEEKVENIPAPLVIFLLKDKASFVNASPEQLWNKDKWKQTLGADLVGEARESGVAAGQEVKVDLGQLSADVRFVGVLAKVPKQDPPVTRHLAVTKDEADDYPFEVIDYQLQLKKK